MLQHIIRHSFAEREASSWLPTETAQTRNRSQQLSPEKAECPLPRTESVARRTPQHSQGTEPTPSRGERCVTGRLAVEVCRNCTFSDVCRWQDIDAMHSQAPGDGRICAKCVLGRLVVAIFSRGASPPSVRRRQDCALMRSWPDWQWQYSRAMRSRGSCRGKIPPRCVPGRQSVASFSPHASRKRPRAGKPPVRGKIRAPCIRKRAGSGRICAPCVRNAPQIAVGGYTARGSCQEGPLFAARAPRITHGAQILPSFGAREERIRPKMPTFCQKLSP